MRKRHWFEVHRSYSVECERCGTLPRRDEFTAEQRERARWIDALRYALPVERSLSFHEIALVEDHVRRLREHDLTNWKGA